MATNEELIAAAQMLKDNCKMRSSICGSCPFNGKECRISRRIGTTIPAYWIIPKLPRWTPEDVALAKALKTVGAVSVFRPKDVSCTRWQSRSDGGWLPSGAFDSVESDEIITLDQIIREGDAHDEH